MFEHNGVYTFSAGEADYVADILRGVIAIQTADGYVSTILQDMVDALENADQILVDDESLVEID